MSMTSNVKLASSMCCFYIPVCICFTTGMVYVSDARDGPLFLIELSLGKIELE